MKADGGGVVSKDNRILSIYLSGIDSIGYPDNNVIVDGKLVTVTYNFNPKYLRSFLQSTHGKSVRVFTAHKEHKRLLNWTGEMQSVICITMHLILLRFETVIGSICY